MRKRQKMVTVDLGIYFIEIFAGYSVNYLKAVVVEGIGMGEGQRDRIEPDLRLAVPDRVIFCVLGDIDKVALVCKIGVSVVEKFSHSTRDISYTRKGVGL